MNARKSDKVVRRGDVKVVEFSLLGLSASLMFYARNSHQNVGPLRCIRRALLA